MGQLIPSIRVHKTNDDLVNALVKNNFILSKDLEEVFRCVDRGFFFQSTNRNLAYCDSFWVSNVTNLATPNIYASVLEGLKLQKGHKFLCIGSGIGYLNTVAGLLLDVNGVNHGIEVNQLKYNHSLLKLEEFILSSAAIDYYNFCEPVFVHGNACDLWSMSYYDRIYCGADVPPEELYFFKSLINIGGVLVLPFDGCLIKITRDGEYKWQTDVLKVLEISFSGLVIPPKYSYNIVAFPSVEPLSLQELCRSSIRTCLSKNLQKQFPYLSINTKLGSTFNLTTKASKEYALETNSSCLALSEASDDSFKRKFSEAGSSKKNETHTEEENSEKMKIDTSSHESEKTLSTSSSYDSSSWETSHSFPSSLSSYSDSESFGSSVDDDEYEEIVILGNNLLEELFHLEESETDSENESDSEIEGFVKDHTKNELSYLLKMKIDMLPLPNRLKYFLNYYRSF